MEAEARYAHLKELAASTPNFDSKSDVTDPVIAEWLGRLHAILDQDRVSIDAIQVASASNNLGGILHDNSVKTILAALHRAIAKVELQLPAASRGAFVAAGNAFDAITVAAKIFAEARRDILIVDPYLGSRALESYAIQAAEGVAVSLLGAAGRVQAGLEPVARAWIQQYGAKRPLKLRYAPAKFLHDRLVIVDNTSVWDFSQSFEHLAARSPATISKAAPEQASMKLQAYSRLFNDAEVIL